MMIQRFLGLMIFLMLAGALPAADEFVDFQSGVLHLNKDAEVAVYVAADAPNGVKAAAENLCRDITAVCGAKAFLADKPSKARIVVATKPDGKWECFTLKADKKRLTITGSDRRGTIYGIYELSRQIGVSPWYWWADVPVKRHANLYIKEGIFTDGEPDVRYRGIFINDEDWGLLPWAANNFEKEHGDIGPKTYEKVCELILRLKGNMLAPAMHSCTGAFYSHPESKLVADSLGIVITTSHCEPLLLNNAAKSEWDKARDGEWNYATNKETIQRKWDARLSEAAHLDNIYTMAMRGVHDEGLRGNLPMNERVSLLNQVIRDQRELLSSHIGKPSEEIPQIFVPYKETMDVYESGLEVPEDITIVWVDDNYGYMKRISSPEEQQRKGGSGVYYHLSYLGTPHDYLWLNTTSPMLMYLELMKAYRAGADRYWLLNVGDIKPMELGISTFFDMAWDTGKWQAHNIMQQQPEFLWEIFGEENNLDEILDRYYCLAWTRKPEYMGGEWEWDDADHTRIQDTQFSFEDCTAQDRLCEYAYISDMTEKLMKTLSKELRPAFFEMVGYPVLAAYQMNRKFLYAQLNRHMAAEGRKGEANWAAHWAQAAHDSIASLTMRYNKQLGGKWDGMMAVPPGYTALYHKMPELVVFDSVEAKGMILKDLVTQAEQPRVNLHRPLSYTGDYSYIYGIGKDGMTVKLGDANNEASQATATFKLPVNNGDSVEIRLSAVPFFPVYKGKGNRIGVSVDGSEMQVVENHVEEWSREWKEQVMINEKSFILRFPLDKSRQEHTITLTSIDPGQIVQQLTVLK